jgi:hypothetical protein
LTNEKLDGKENAQSRVIDLLKRMPLMSEGLMLSHYYQRMEKGCFLCNFACSSFRILCDIGTYLDKQKRIEYLFEINAIAFLFLKNQD